MKDLWFCSVQFPKVQENISPLVFNKNEKSFQNFVINNFVLQKHTLTPFNLNYRVNFYWICFPPTSFRFHSEQSKIFVHHLKGGLEIWYVFFEVAKKSQLENRILTLSANLKQRKIKSNKNLSWERLRDHIEIGITLKTNFVKPVWRIWCWQRMF